MSRILSPLLVATVACLSLGCHRPTTTSTPTNTMPHSDSMPKDHKASPIDFARIARFPPPGWQIPRQTRWSPDGALVTYLKNEGGDGKQSAKMALFAFDLKSGTHRVIVRAEDLATAKRPMSREEELRRERQRKRITGITSYRWASTNNTMLLPYGGDIYIRKADATIVRLTDSAKPEIDPKMCADGSKVAFVSGQELFLIETETQKQRQLTKDAPKGVTRGQSDFNGQEEFGEPSGHWWSPDCKHLAYLEVNESKVSEVDILGYRGDEDHQRMRYPRAGSTNPTTRLGVMDTDSGKTTWVTMPDAKGLDAGDQYLGRMHWSKDGKHLFFQRLSRNQQDLVLTRFDLDSSKSHSLLTEHDDAWLDMSAMQLLPSGPVAWTALRDGHRHIELRDAATGKVTKTLTKGTWDVSGLRGFDEGSGRLYFIANKDAVLDRQLYSVDIKSGAIERHTTEDGVHEVTTHSPSKGFVDIHSANGRLPAAIIYGPDNKKRGSIDIPKDEDFDALNIRTPALFTVNDDKGPELHGAILKPRNMKPGVRYPVVVMVYGGPGVQVVQNEYNPRLIWQHLADRGFVVVQVDNRGSKGRGHAFETPLYRKMGSVELADQLRLLDHLTTLDFVDTKRAGIYGHSYGGYMAAMAMLRAPGRFQAGVAGSPVTDWRFYDTGYTERFMGTPQNNTEGYTGSDLTNDADKLQGKLFIIHALMDENVHFAHTAKLIDALVAADKDFDLMVFPGERHGYRSPASRRYAYRRVVDYFVEHLGR